MSWLPLALRRLSPNWRSDTPEAFLLEGRRPETTTLVVCVGDSITQGQVSANYVTRLDQRLRPRGYQFVNAGINGNLAFNIVKRLDAVIACRPDVVTLLVGTNDINARFNDFWEQRYRKEQGLPVSPTLSWYCENIHAVITRLKAETQAKIVLLELPMLGEDLGGRMNGLVRDYNAALREIAAQHGITCLPLYDHLVALLPPGHTPPPYAGDINFILKAAVSAFLFRRSWDDIARQNGMIVLTDHLHLSDQAAQVVADLLGDFLEG